MTQTLGFHMYFSLDLQRLSQALRLVAANPLASTDELAAGMGVNGPVARGFRAWLEHIGLATILAGGALAVTPFGSLVLKHDPYLSDLGTLWLLHYYLSSEHNPRSDAWYVLMNHYLHQGRTFTAQQYATYLADFLGPRATNKRGLKGDPQKALATYTGEGALARLGLLKEKAGVYSTGYPNLPDSLVVGVMLLDWWSTSHNGVNTVRFSQLVDETGSLGRICLADERQTRRFVYSLADLGVLSFSESQHEPINRLCDSPPIVLLQRYYEKQP